ncbi:hypothetical protein_gp275 [Bacillus phage vB_BceM_WH1]|nr:hypothetical protein_gp275 [Bacillus phage vB_BceM_WH1]
MTVWAILFILSFFLSMYLMIGGLSKDQKVADAKKKLRRAEEAHKKEIEELKAQHAKQIKDRDDITIEVVDKAADKIRSLGAIIDKRDGKGTAREIVTERTHYNEQRTDISYRVLYDHLAKQLDKKPEQPKPVQMKKHVTPFGGWSGGSGGSSSSSSSSSSSPRRSGSSSSSRSSSSSDYSSSYDYGSSYSSYDSGSSSSYSSGGSCGSSSSSYSDSSSSSDSGGYGGCD